MATHSLFLFKHVLVGCSWGFWYEALRPLWQWQASDVFMNAWDFLLYDYYYHHRFVGLGGGYGRRLLSMSFAWLRLYVRASDSVAEQRTMLSFTSTTTSVSVSIPVSDCSFTNSSRQRVSGVSIHVPLVSNEDIARDIGSKHYE